MMALNQLPPEVALNILLQMSPSDRMRASAMCRTWTEAATYAEAVSDVWMTIHGSDLARGISSTVSGSRQYGNIRIIKADLRKVGPDFLAMLGSSIRQLEFVGCRPEKHRVERVNFDKILKHCPQLRSISLKETEEHGPVATSTLRPTRNLPSDEITERLQILRSTFQCCGEPSKRVENFLSLIPNVTSITVEARSCITELRIALLLGEVVFTKLDFSKANVTDEAVLGAVDLYSKCLEELLINGTVLTRSSYAGLSRCSKLTSLHIHHAFELHDPELHNIIVGAPKLESLSLGGCSQVTDKALVHIADLGRLRRLHLKDCVATSADTFDALNRSTSLEALAFGSSFINSKNLRKLLDLTSLRELCLAVEVTRDCFDEIRRSFKNLEKLELGSCAKLTDMEGMKFRLFTRLRSLTFTHGIHFTNRTFERGLGSPHMEYLSITNTPLTERALTSIGARHPRLEELVLRKCASVTDDSMRDLLPLLRNIRRFALPSCTSLTGDFLAMLASSCPRLRYVEMHDSPTISHRAKRFFRNRKPRVMISYSNKR